MSAPAPLRAYSPLKFNEVALLGAILSVILATLAIDSNHSYYYEFGNSATEIVRSTSRLGIVALGAAVVIIAGGIDLSAGSVMASSALIAAAILTLCGDEQGKFATVGAGPIALAIAGALVFGLMVGTLHAWLITSVGLPPFVATLATLVGLRSFARALCKFVMSIKVGSESEQINVVHPFFKYVREHVSLVVIAFGLLALFTWFLLTKTPLGRHAYALGGNEQAAKLSGVRTDNVKWFAYCFSAVAASLAGLFFMADASVARPSNQAAGYELNAIAAAVVGGCSLQGGVGHVPGVVLGALFLRVVIDAISKIIKSGSDVWEGMIVGIVVVLAVTFTQLQELLRSGRTFFGGARGKFAIPTIAVLATLVALSATTSNPALRSHSGLIGGIVFAVVMVSLIAVERWESLRQSRDK